MKMNQFFATLSTASLLLLPVATLAENTDAAAAAPTAKPTRVEVLEQRMKKEAEGDVKRLEMRKVQLNSVAKLQSLTNECRATKRTTLLSAEKDFVAAQKAANDTYKAAVKAAQEARKTALEAARNARKTLVSSLQDSVKACEKSAKDVVSQPTPPVTTPAVETPVNTSVTQ